MTSSDGVRLAPVARPVGRWPGHAASFGTVLIGTVVLDQLTKWMVLRRIQPGHPVKLFGSVVFRRAFNTGVAFTLGESQEWLPYVLPFVVAALAAWAVHNVIRRNANPLVFGLLVGGALGNLLDRSFRGERFLRGAVVDFIDVGIFNFPVFNVADSALTVGCGALLIVTLLQSRAGARVDPAVAPPTHRRVETLTHITTDPAVAETELP